VNDISAGSFTRKPPAAGGQKPVLTEDEATRRVVLLGDLQAALAGIGVPSVLARNHRLVLRWYSSGPFGPSGLTDPELYVFASSGTSVATTDGTAYHLAGVRTCPAADPAAAAAVVRDHTAAHVAAER
jgi:hypothetical protein